MAAVTPGRMSGSNFLESLPSPGGPVCELATALAWLLVSVWLENVPQQICLFLVARSLGVPETASLQCQSSISGGKLRI